MAYPVTGPYTTTHDTDVIAGIFVGRREYKSTYRQKPPYNLALDYVHKRYEVTLWGQPSWNPANGGVDEYKPHEIDNLSGLNAQALAKARERFNSKVGDTASLLISLAERKQAMTMMSSRLLQMARFTVALKRGSVHLAAKALGVLKNPKLFKIYLQKLKNGVFLAFRKWRGKKTAEHKLFADTYLEFHFGWSPLVGDIHSAASILSAPVPDGKVRGSATLKLDELSGWLGYYKNTFVTRKTSVRAAIQATVSVANSNLFLADRLGLLNLAALPFELISYSFVFDWFVNVSEFLGQFTELSGLSLANLMHSIKTTSVCNVIGREPWAPLPCGAEATGFRRIVGPLPFVNLAVRAPWRLSPRRGLAAISLLLQKMS